MAVNTTKRSETETDRLTDLRSLTRQDRTRGKRSAPTPPFQEHARLAFLADRLRLMALCPPDVVAERRWLELIHTEINDLGNVLFRHFAFEEHGGYFAEVLLEHPSLADCISRLEHEHDMMTAELEAILNLLCGKPSRSVVAARIVALLDTFAAHEQTENQLAQDAVLVDLGG